MEDIAGFVSAWVAAASNAAGDSARTLADLEPLESQSQLMGLIQAATTGINNGRKLLVQLGPNPPLPEVEAVLQDVAWRCGCRSKGHCFEVCEAAFDES